MNKLQIKINPKVITTMHVHNSNYQVVHTPHNLCVGCAFNSCDNLNCPAWDMTCRRESRGLLCTAFVNEKGEQLTVIFKHHSETDIPQVFIDKPVWEKELNAVHLIEHDAFVEGDQS